MFTFCTDTLRYSFDEKGMVREFTDIASGKDHAVPGCAAFYLLEGMKKHRLNTDEGEVWFEHHLKIDNTDLSPDEAADRVIEAFGLVPREKEASEYRFGV